MTGIEIAGVVIGGLTMLGGLIKYADTKYGKLHEELHIYKEETEKRINELEKQSLLGDERIKGHINSCVNWKRRDGHID